MNDSDQLWDMLCCADTNHTIKQGGKHINLVQLKKVAKWPYLAALNFLVPESKDHPLAVAVVCDSCLQALREIKFAVGGQDGANGHVEYFRVPIDQLEDPKFFWPAHHPDRLNEGRKEPNIAQLKSTHIIMDFL